MHQGWEQFDISVTVLHKHSVDLKGACHTVTYCIVDFLTQPIIG